MYVEDVCVLSRFGNTPNAETSAQEMEKSKMEEETLLLLFCFENFSIQ